MTLVPADTTRAIVETERPATLAWAERRGWSIAFDMDALRLSGTVEHPADGAGHLHLSAELSGYQAVPPAWSFVDPSSGVPSPTRFPAAGTVAGKSSIFHPSLVICAPFNRLAYAEHGGPHTNWSGPSSWRGVTGYVMATTIPAMLAVIDLHLHYSPGMRS